MFDLRNKTILIISPQAWGSMFISKHHYAVELAKQGNSVYFLNPPEQQGKGKAFIDIKPIEGHGNLFLINHRLWFPFILKFHALPVFHWLMRWYVPKLIKQIGIVVDIVWSFDLGNLYPFYCFSKRCIKVFHPVDEPLSKPALDAAKGADILFSVTKEILEKYQHYRIPRFFINHGVSEIFLQKPGADYSVHAPVRVGFSGNLLRKDIDRKIFIDIIRGNPDVLFTCWGGFSVKESNIGGNEDTRSIAFISQLQSLPNVKLCGAVSSERLAAEMKHIDAFLICYDIKLDQSSGTNYHKIMEYMGSGKVIISNNVTTYANQPDLLQMTSSRENNQELPQLFTQIISNLSGFNRYELQYKRISFAEDNTYSRQLTRIEKRIAGVLNRKNKKTSHR